MKTTDRDEIDIDLMELFYVVKSKVWILLLTGMIAAAGAGLFSKLMITPIYQSTSSLYVVNKTASLTSLSLSDLQLGSQLTKDYMVLVKSRPVTDNVIGNLNLNMTHEGLVSIMSINNPTDTRILEITIHYPDAYIAKQIVDEVASVSSRRMAVIMDIQEPNIVEEGYVESYPVSPNVKKNAVMAGVLGIALATGVICVLYLMNDTIKSSEDVERYLGISTIGLIPMQQDVIEMHKSKNKNNKNSKSNKNNRNNKKKNNKNNKNNENNDKTAKKTKTETEQQSA